jgi:hypothetical protein
MQGVLKGALQWYSKCYCLASVTKTFTLKGVQSVHPSTSELGLSKPQGLVRAEGLSNSLLRQTNNERFQSFRVTITLDTLSQPSNQGETNSSWRK